MLQTTAMQAITRAGNRLVAVGIRGLVIYSDDAGETWQQAEVPVATDLLDVHFATAEQGWAVGHDGAILHTADGGRQWHRQLDGLETRKLLAAHFRDLAAQGDPRAPQLQKDLEINYTNGPEQSLLSVWFSDDKRGWAAGSFGTLLRTEDGGATWTSAVEWVTADTPSHYYAVCGVGGSVALASERGTVYSLGATARHFTAETTGYTGTFFVLANTGEQLLAAGLQGNVYRRDSKGTWSKLANAATASFTAAASLGDGRALLANQAGQVFVVSAQENALAPMSIERPMLFTGAVIAPDQRHVVFTGLDGVRRMRLPPAAT